MNFNIGDQIIMSTHNGGERDDLNVPLGTWGTIIQVASNDDDDDDGTLVGVDWEHCIAGPAGKSYSREFYNEDEDTYHTYYNVWFVSQESLSFLDEGKRNHMKTLKVINKIKQLEKKVKDRTLPLRKVRAINFPDKKVPV